MIIGVPKEIKNKENRVGMTPRGVGKMVKAGHQVLVQKDAGVGSGFLDVEYKKFGAKIINSAKEVYKKADMIVKIKEILEPEFELVQEGQTIFTYLHLAAEKKLTKFLLKKKVTGIAYETVETDNHELPLLEPMSQVAGRMSIQVGAHFLEKTQGGRGVLLGGTDEVYPAKVVVLGYGIVGGNAVQMARGLGADVTVFDVDQKKIDRINKSKDELFKAKFSSKKNIADALKDADLVVGAVLVAGACAPKLVSREMIKSMKPGSVVVDVAIDQGGCFETSKPTSHENPIYLVDGVIHYCVTNMPGAVARTSALALTERTIDYAISLANKGVVKAVKQDKALAKGVNTYQGKLTCQGVAEAFDLKYTPLDNVLENYK